MKKVTFYITAVVAMLCTACSNNDVQYDASGVLETTEVIVSATGTGELGSFHVDEGQNVSMGQALGRIDTLQLYLKKKQLLSNISATESKRLSESRQVASIQQQISNLQRERKRFKELVKENAANQKQVDDIDYQIMVLQRQLAATS